MKKVFVVFLLAVLMLTACGKEEAPVPPKEFEMEDIAITLPKEISRKSISPTQDHFTMEGQVIGGIALLELDRETMEALRHSFDYTDTILTYIKENILPDYDEARFDGYMMGSSAYGYFDVSMITLDGETMHYLLEGKDAYFDVWFDTMHTDARTQAGIIESIRSEALTVTGQMTFIEEAG